MNNIFLFIIIIRIFNIFLILIYLDSLLLNRLLYNILLLNKLLMFIFLITFLIIFKRIFIKYTYLILRIIFLLAIIYNIFIN